MKRTIRRLGLFSAVLTAGVSGCQNLAKPWSASSSAAVAPTEGPMLTAPSAPANNVSLNLSSSASESGLAASATVTAPRGDQRLIDGYLRMAAAHDKIGKFEDAGRMYAKALAVRPDDADVLCNLGYSCILQKKYEAAEKNLRQAVAAHPAHLRACNNLGLALVCRDKLDEAFNEFRKGGCADADAHVNAGFALTLAQRFEEAESHYRAALQLDAHHTAAKQAIAEMAALAPEAKNRPRVADSKVQQVAWSPSREKLEPAKAAAAAPGEALPPALRVPPVNDAGVDVVAAADQPAAVGATESTVAEGGSQPLWLMLCGAAGLGFLTAALWPLIRLPRGRRLAVVACGSVIRLPLRVVWLLAGCVSACCCMIFGKVSQARKAWTQRRAIADRKEPCAAKPTVVVRWMPNKAA